MTSQVVAPTRTTSVSSSDSQRASLEVRKTTSTESLGLGSSKQPLHRLRPAVDRYLKMLNIHLGRLRQHQANMEKMAQTEKWTQLHMEQTKASSTVQQMMAMLRELQRIGLQVPDNQLPEFYTLMQEYGNNAATSLQALLVLCQHKPCTKENSSDTASADSSLMASSTQPLLPTIPEQQVAMTYNWAVPDNTEAAASREQLTQEIKLLQALVLHFLHTVTDNSEQTEAEENTENGNVETPSNPADNATFGKTLQRNKLKLAVLLVVGALLGGAVAGPMGLFAGIKIGTMAGTVGGGVAGLAGTTILNSQEKAKEASLDTKAKDDDAAADSSCTPWSRPSTSSSPPPTPLTLHGGSGMASSMFVSSSSPLPCQVSPVQSRDDSTFFTSSDGNGNVSFWDRILP